MGGYRAWQTVETNACLVQWLFTLTYSCLVSSSMLNLGFNSSSSIFSTYKQLLNLIYWLGEEDSVRVRNIFLPAW